jgi:FkbM family methyltransferase
MVSLTVRTMIMGLFLSHFIVALNSGQCKDPDQDTINSLSPGMCKKLTFRKESIALKTLSALDSSNSWANLRRLDLSTGDFGLETARAVSVAMLKATSLRSVSLDDNPRIGNAGVALIAASLAENMSLLKISFANSGVGDEGVVALVRALSTNSHLEVLKLDQNPISAKGALALANALDSRAIQVLELTFFSLQEDTLPGMNPDEDTAPPLTSDDTLSLSQLFANTGADQACLLLELAGVFRASQGRSRINDPTKDCAALRRRGGTDPAASLPAFLHFMRNSPEGILARAFKRYLGAAVPVKNTPLEAVKCTKTQAHRNFEHFVQRGGLGASSCPKTYHLNMLAQSMCASAEKGNALVIGGNTGSDCVGFARFLSGDPSVSLARWQTDLEKHTKQRFPRPKCIGSGGGQGVEEYPLVTPFGLEAHRKAFCVEPLPQNFDVLNTTSHYGSWDQLQMIHAAVADRVPEKGTFGFPARASFGLETAHIGQAQENTVLVRGTTVDEIVTHEMGGVVPYLLAVDTEGFDALVLRGANRTLATGKVKYIEFEYHNIAPWRNMNLRPTIESLDAAGYTCYWAQPRLVLITGCWDWGAFGAMHEWSNVVCARRDDTCWSAALSKAAFRVW